MVAILIVSAKLATLGLPEIKVFYNKGFDVNVTVHDVTTKFYNKTQIILQMWSCDQGLVTLALL